MSHQSVNLRVGTPDIFGDDESRKKHENECQTIRRTMTVRYQVAPRMRVTTSTGRNIEANQPITVGDFHGWPQPAWSLLERAVREGRVLEADNPVGGAGDGPEAA